MTGLSQEEVNKIFSALIAEYLPPVTEIKPNKIEKIRGVSCGHTISKLVEYGLVLELGK